MFALNSMLRCIGFPTFSPSMYYYNVFAISYFVFRHYYIDNNNNNELHFYSAFPSAQSALQWFIHSYIGKWSGEHSTPASSLPTFTHQWWQACTNQLIGGNVGFSVLPKDTSTCWQEELGLEPPTHGSLANPLYLLSYSRPRKMYSLLFNVLNCIKQCCALIKQLKE